MNYELFNLFANTLQKRTKGEAKRRIHDNEALAMQKAATAPM